MATWDPRANELFLQALELRSDAERREYLDRECGPDAALRAAVESLLEANARAGCFLESPARDPVATVEESPVAERPGTVIGPYKLLEQIGEGGFGVVFMAEQQRPVRRRIALKVLKPGMDSKQVIARFEAERQALALMDHPNIARVFDGGQTPAGRPYFVMELVRGVPITDFCDRNHLTPRERLELFVSVCQAVQHAHQKGIIHRDLKPSNVLVSMHDTTPVVKVIDFGVAKALGQELTDKTLFTGFAQMIGTPLYMSPEQAGQSGLDVDTRSDVYSLGVLLYELLTGTTPFDKDRLRTANYEQIRRIIREEEPARPSTRIHTLGQEAATVSANRQSDPRKLGQLLRGEVDWIVMKALEKDRNRRYESASAFAADVQRFLRDEPVLACRPSVGYWLRKFVRRNWGAVLATALVLLALVGGVLGTTLGMFRAIEAETGARSEAAQKEKALKDAEAALAAARQSERARTEQLVEALVAEARATRLGRRTGQRFQSLEILGRASQLAHSLSLPASKLHEQRSAAIAALAMPDLYLAGPWLPCPADMYAFDFDDDHALCALTNWQGACSLRRVADGVELQRLPGVGMPAHPYFSRDGKFLALTHFDVKSKSTVAVQLWQLDGRTQRLLLTEKGAGFGAFNPKASQVGVVYNDGAIGLFELPSGRQLGRLAPDTLTREVTIALHPTEPVVAVCSYFGSVVQLRDVQTGKVLATLAQGTRPHSVAWHPDGQTLAVGLAEACQVRLYDRATLRLFRTLDTTQTATQVAFNHAGDRLAVVGWSHHVELFDVGTGQKLFVSPPVSLVSLGCPRFSRDDRRLAGAVQDGKLGIWQVGDSREYRTLAHKGMPAPVYAAAAVSPDGRLLALGTTDGFGLWDLAGGSELCFIPTGGNNDLVRFEPSGALLVLCARGLFRWPIGKDLAGRPGAIGPPEPLPLPRGSSLGQSSDGRVIVTCARAIVQEQAYAGGWVWHTDRPGKPIRLDAGADIGYIAVSPDGRWVVTSTHQYAVGKVWDAGDGKLVKRLAERGLGYPQFSPDGRWLSTALDGGRLLAVGTWEGGPTSGDGTFAPDSKLLAVPTAAGVRLREAATGREVALLEDPNLDLSPHPVFTPDGTKLIALNHHNGAHVWDLRLLRRHLKEMGLDWDWPEFAEDVGKTGAPPSSVPPVIRIDAEPVKWKAEPTKD